MKGVKVTAQPNGTFDRADALELGRLLMKAGYTVMVGEEEAGEEESGMRFRSAVTFSESKTLAGGGCNNSLNSEDE